MNKMRINGDFEMYWKKRFNEAALSFENDADIGLLSEHGFKQRFLAFLIFLKKFLLLKN